MMNMISIRQDYSVFEESTAKIFGLTLPKGKPAPEAVKNLLEAMQRKLEVTTFLKKIEL